MNGLTAHAAPQHDMNMMSHDGYSTSATQCLALCNTALIKKAESQYLFDGQKDDEPIEPAPLIASVQIYTLLSQELSARAGFRTKFEPPPRLKPYLELSVFRT